MTTCLLIVFSSAVFKLFWEQFCASAPLPPPPPWQVAPAGGVVRDLAPTATTIFSFFPFQLLFRQFQAVHVGRLDSSRQSMQVQVGQFRKSCQAQEFLVYKKQFQAAVHVIQFLQPVKQSIKLGSKQSIFYQVVEDSITPVKSESRVHVIKRSRQGTICIIQISQAIGQNSKFR